VKVILLSTVALGSVLAMVAPAMAQSATPAAATEPGDADIIVTATRRSERLQSIPLAVTALNSEEIQNRVITNSRDLVVTIPNMAINFANGPNSPQYNLRGIGANDNFVTSAAAVGVYFDDVYANNIFGQSYPVFDIQRIEVLRGPQGTLWGKNTTAGAINFVTQAPKDEFDGYSFGPSRTSEISVWVRNLTDRFYRTSRNANDALRSVAFTRGDPRTFGASFRQKF